MKLDPCCQKCGKRNRLIGIEPHHKFINLDVWTYECTACGNFDVVSQLAPAEMMSANTTAHGHGLLN